MKNNSGFSIIEILIAITLLSAITFGVISLTNNATNTKDRVLSEDKVKLQIVTALSVLEWDLSQIYSPLYFAKRLVQKGRITSDIFQRANDQFQRNPHFGFVDIDGRPVPLFEQSDKSSFEFFTASHRRRVQNVKQSNFAWVKYVLEAEDTPTDEKDEKEDKSGKMKIVRYYSADNPYKPEKLDSSKLKGQTILENVEEVEFSFWNPENQKFTTPLSSISGGVNLLRGISVKIVWKDFYGVSETITKIYRPLWPVFDASADPDDLEFVNNPNTNQQTPQAPPAATPIPGTEQEDDLE